MNSTLRHDMKAMMDHKAEKSPAPPAEAKGEDAAHAGMGMMSTSKIPQGSEYTLFKVHIMREENVSLPLPRALGQDLNVTNAARPKTPTSRAASKFP